MFLLLARLFVSHQWICGHYFTVTKSSTNGFRSGQQFKLMLGLSVW